MLKLTHPGLRAGLQTIPWDEWSGHGGQETADVAPEEDRQSGEREHRVEDQAQGCCQHQGAAWHSGLHGSQQGNPNSVIKNM